MFNIIFTPRSLGNTQVGLSVLVIKISNTFLEMKLIDSLQEFQF